MIWSPITIGTAFPQHIRKEKKQYRSGEFVHRIYIAPSLQHLPRGILLDMPDTDIEEYLRNSIDLQWLSSDEDLIHFMQTFIEEHQ